MNYTLAAKLKLSGFPQKGLSGGFKLYPEEDENAPKEISRGTVLKLSDIPMGGVLWVDNSAYAPTLSELIESCGDNIETIQKGSWRGKGKWVAYKNRWDDSISMPIMIEPVGVGETPEESVARLWLVLNQKS